MKTKLKNSNKIISLVLALVMVVSLLPMNILMATAAPAETSELPTSYNGWNPTFATYTEGLTQYFKYGGYLYKAVWKNCNATSVVLYKSSSDALYYMRNGTNWGIKLCKGSTGNSNKFTVYQLPKTVNGVLVAYGSSSTEVKDTSSHILEITCIGVKAPTWTWSDDKTSATAVFVSEDGKAQVTIGATVTSGTEAAENCQEKDKIIYTASATFNGTAYSDVKTVDGAAGNHTGGKATCTAKAVCEVCGKEYGDTNPNNHNIIIDQAVAPDCENTGLTEGQHCEYCDAMTIAQKTIPALNHKDTLVQVDAKAPTCDAVGWEAYEYCTACDYTTYVEKEALNHKDTLVKVDAKAPTCTEIGWDAYEYCTACTYTTYVELPVDADAHDWSNKDGVCAYGCGTVCDHAGQTGDACAICGVELHTCDFTGEWKYDTEKHWKECECGEVTESAHVYTDGVCDVCGYECLHENWTDGTCDACGYDCEHAFDTDANIMTALTCERCGYTYKSDKRWAEGVYETYYNGLVAMLNSHYYDDDEIVAYFALDTVDGEESSISFDWAINQGFTEYGEFSLHFYHNGKEVITHDFSSTPNPYDNILSEEYKFTAEGETQIFKFVFKKDYYGYWYDDGRTAYLNIKDHSHVFGEATDTQPASCKTCNKTQCEIVGHDWSNLDSVCAVCGYECPHGSWTDGICDVCAFECPHEDTYNNLIRPVQNADGTWGKGKVVEICNICGNSSLVQEVERDHEGYKVFDETAAELEAILNSGKMTDTWKNDYTNRLNGLRNSAYYQVYTEIETAIPSMTESLKSIIAAIEAGIADGTMIKADFTYMTSLFDEINALIDNDPNKLIPSESGRFQGIYYGYYMSCKNDGNHSQADYDQNMAGNNWEGQIEAILAGVKDGTALKADYTEIDEAIAALDEKLADVNLTDEAKAGLEEIKAELEEMKKDPVSSKADLAELEKALDEYEAELDAGIKDGTIVLVDVYKILEEYDIVRTADLEEKYGRKKVDEVFLKIHRKNPGVIESIWEYADSITGTVAETADEIEELKARVDALYAAIERCIIGTHNVEEYEVVSPAKCEANAIESGTCTLCVEVLTREVENSALKHSFTKYEVTQEAKCGVEGKEVAYCDNGCGATNEKAIEALKHIPLDAVKENEVDPECEKEGSYDLVVYCDLCGGEISRETFAVDALEHLFLDYIYNEDATCTADGTKTAECIYGCGETDTVTAEDTMLNHADEDGDGICDDCETEIKDVCSDCGGPAHEETGVPQYICMLITLIKLVVALVQALQSLQTVA